MNDTAPDAASQFARLLRERSGSDRIRMVSDMFETARALVIAGIREQCPDIDDAGLRIRVFRRFYANDLSSQDLIAISDRLGARGSTPAPDAIRK